MRLGEKKEWYKRVFEIKLENIYDNGMTCIHENEVNKIAEFHLLHDILNFYKHTKI